MAKGVVLLAGLSGVSNVAYLDLPFTPLTAALTNSWYVLVEWLVIIRL